MKKASGKGPGYGKDKPGKRMTGEDPTADGKLKGKAKGLDKKHSPK